jgi:hypothetical protein
MGMAKDGEENKASSSKITINHHFGRLDHAVWNRWVLIVVIIANVSLQSLSMRAKRWQLNVDWRRLMRGRWNAQRHIIILILRR